MRRALIAAAVLALGGGRSLAETPLEPPDLSRYLRWGPFRVRPGIGFSNIGYEDNIFYQSAEQPKVSDYTATITPRLDGVVLFGRRAFVTFTEALGYTLYVRNGDQNYLSNAGSARLTVPFRRMGIWADLGINNTRDRPYYQQDTRPILKELRYGGGLIFLFGWRTDVEIGFVRRNFDASDPDENLVDLIERGATPIGAQLDRVDQGLTLKARYLAFGRTRFTLDVADRTISFDRARLTTSSPDRDSRSTTVLPGVSFAEGGPLTGTLQVGWSRLRRNAKELPSFSGWVGDAKLAYLFSGGTRLLVEARREVGFSIYWNNNYYTHGSVNLRATHYFSRLLGMDLAAGGGRVGFVGPPPTGAAGDYEAARIDRYVQYEAGIRLRFSETGLGRRVEYLVSVRRWLLNTSIDDRCLPTGACAYRDQSRTSIGVSANIGY